MMTDPRTNAEALAGLFDTEMLLSDEFSRKKKRAKDPLASLLSVAPLSPMEQAVEKYGKGGAMARNIGSILTAGLFDSVLMPEMTRENRAQYATDLKAHKELQGVQSLIDMSNPYIAAMQDDDPANNAQALFALGQMGVSDKAIGMMFPNSVAGKPSEFYAGDLIFDEETGRYGQIMMDKHGGQSQTKWYKPGQIPKEAMLSRESFDAKYNDTLKARGVAQSNYNQTQRSIDMISAVSDEDWTAGLAGDVESFWKQKITGNEDREQWAKKSAINVRNLQQMGMLPPGPATDRDVDLVMKGAPGDQASKETWMEYLAAAQRLNEKAVYFQNAKMQWMDERGLRGMQGFNKHWEEINPYKEEAPRPSEGLPPMPEGAGIDQAIWDVMTPEERALWN